MSGADLGLARTFLWLHGRLVDRRLFECAFEGASPRAVADAVRAYANPDGGLGHALEADLRAPSSQPIFVDAGLTILHEGGAKDDALVRGTCDFLARVAREDGAIPYALPDALRHPRADHWNGDYALTPSLLATSGVCARLHAVGAPRHAWLDRATEWCFVQLAGHPEYSPHRLLNALEFLVHAPDRDRAERTWPHVTSRAFEADYVAMETPHTGYGLSPLRFAYGPGHRSRSLFPDDVIDRHLDYLESQQQEDGGWPISRSPPGASAAWEWRARWTLDALRVLRAYARL